MKKIYVILALLLLKQTAHSQNMQPSNLISKPAYSQPEANVAILKNPIMYGEGNAYSGGSVLGALQLVTPLADFMFDIEGTIMRFGPGWQEKIRFNLNAYGWSGTTTINYTANPIRAYWDKRLPDMSSLSVTLGNLSVNGSPKTTITIGDGNTNWGSYMVIVIDQIYLTNKLAGSYLYDDSQWKLSKVLQVSTTENVSTIFTKPNVDITSINGLQNILDNKANLTGNNVFLGSQSVSGSSILNGSVGIGTSYAPQLLTISSTGGIGFSGNGINAEDKKLYSSADGVLEWMTNSYAGEHGFAVSHQNEKKVFLNTNGSSYFLGGNVGIGISSPQEKLAVNGVLRAKAVKVEPLENWPDYVFDNDYKPMSLNDISSFIKKNKHLPEIPSNREVARDGINLGEMNRLLLTKIEELTLHLIEKEAELKSHTQKLEEQEKRISGLEKLIKSKF